MTKYRLSEIAPIQQGFVNKSEKHWLLNLDMVESGTGKIIEYVYAESTDIGASTISFDTNNVLYSKLRPYLNKVVLPDRPGFATSEMLPFRPNQSIITREYLTYFLRSPQFVAYINDKTSGAKMPRANSADLKAVEIDCPPVEEQNRITAAFDSIVLVIEKRQQELSALDDLIKARFVEMFGDPVSKKRQRKKLSDIGKIYTGNTPSMKVPEYYESEDIPFIKPGDIAENGVTLVRHVDSFISEKGRNVARVMPQGSILVTCIGTIGKVGIAARESCCNQQINFIVPNDRYNPIYMAYCLTFFKDVLTEMANAPVVPIINKSQFSDLEIPIVPKVEQDDFAAFVAQVNKSKAIVQKALDATKLLFDSLMQKYFG